MQRTRVDRSAAVVATVSGRPRQVGDDVASPVIGVGQIVVNTGDLNRFRTFYEGLLGLQHVITLRMSEPTQLRYGVFAVGADTSLLAFEVPAYDPADEATGAEAGRRERIDHFALRVDEAALLEVRDRLVAAGASNGIVDDRSPYLSVSFRDPDGLEGKIVCPNYAFDPAEFEGELIECSNPQWTANLLQR